MGTRFKRKNHNGLLLNLFFFLLNIGFLFFSISNASAVALVLPQTGQTSCYDTSGNISSCVNSGQDGEYQQGEPWPSPRFIDNGDGTVTDQLTGLMWLQDASCLGNVNWDSALATVTELNANPGNFSTCSAFTANYNDWALPNIVELASLYNASQSDQGAWLLSQSFTGLQPQLYWTSTTSPDFSLNPIHGYAITVHLGNGSQSISNKSTNPLPLLAVRYHDPAAPSLLRKSGQTASYATGDDGAFQRGANTPAQRFTDLGNGTVFDVTTGLIWLQDADCLFSNYASTDNDDIVGDGKITWQHALDFISGMNGGSFPACGLGHLDWRLPNLAELHSLTDFSSFSPAIADAHPFSQVRSQLYWTSTTDSANPAAAWLVSLDNGLAGSLAKTSYAPLWPVRDSQSSTEYPVAPSAKDFGWVELNSPAPYQTFQISNLSAGDLLLGTVTIVGQNATEFAVANDTCSSQVLAAGTSCTVDVFLTAITTGDKNALLYLPTDFPTFIMPLSAAVHRCGNNILEGPEECDDGNNLDGDGCSAACILICEPGPELCDGIDNNCDGSVDEGCAFTVVQLNSPGSYANWGLLNSTGDAAWVEEDSQYYSSLYYQARDDAQAYQVTTGMYNPYFLRMNTSGDMIWREGLANLYYYHAGNGLISPYSFPGYNFFSADLNDNGIAVWGGKDNPYLADLFLYDSQTNTFTILDGPAIEDGTSNHQVPLINNSDIILWKRISALGHETVFYNPNTGNTVSLTQNSYYSVPSSSTPYYDINNQGDIVWVDGVDQSAEIYLYSAASGVSERLTNNSHPDYLPKINDQGNVVWQAELVAGDPASTEIFLYTQANQLTTQLTSNSYEDSYVVISPDGDVSWIGNSQLQFYLASTGTTVTASDAAGASYRLHSAIDGALLFTKLVDGGSATRVLRLTPNPDFDLDGDTILNGSDNCLRLVNPGQEDADGDGIGDLCDPLNNIDASSDYDGDGLSNLDETNLGTDPQDADTDNDGVCDGFDGHPLDEQLHVCIDLIRNNATQEVFTTLQAAINASNTVANDTIQITAADLNEDLVFDKNITLTLAGGYYCNFSNNPSNSSIRSLIIKDGTLLIRNLVIRLP